MCSNAPYTMRSAMAFLPESISTFMNFATSTLPNFGSGNISRFGTSRRRGIGSPSVMSWRVSHRIWSAPACDPSHPAYPARRAPCGSARPANPSRDRRGSAQPRSPANYGLPRQYKKCPQNRLSISPSPLCAALNSAFWALSYRPACRRPFFADSFPRPDFFFSRARARALYGPTDLWLALSYPEKCSKRKNLLKIKPCILILKVNAGQSLIEYISEPVHDLTARPRACVGRCSESSHIDVYAPVPALRRAGRSRPPSLCDGGDPGAAHCPPGCRAACGPPSRPDPASRVPRAAFRRALLG